MRLFIATLLGTLGTQAWAECGGLCDMLGGTPLHSAATFGEESGIIVSLLETGADPKAINDDGETAWDLAQDNDALKDTKGYWALNLAQ